MNFYDAWWFLFNHKIFEDEYKTSKFQECTFIYIAKVNPINDTIEDDVSLNTKTQVWLKSGEYSKNCRIHDIDLDCGGDSYEQAIIELARLVKLNYN